MFLKCLNNRVDNWWHLKREFHIEGVSHHRQTYYDGSVICSGLTFLVLFPFLHKAKCTWFRIPIILVIGTHGENTLKYPLDC